MRRESFKTLNYKPHGAEGLEPDVVLFTGKWAYFL